MATVIAVCRSCGYQEMFSDRPSSPPQKEDLAYAKMKESSSCPSCSASIELCPV